MKSAITVTEKVTLQKIVEALEDDIQDQDREVRAGIETTEAEIDQTLETEIDETIETDLQLDIEKEVLEELIEEEMTPQEGTIETTVKIVHQLGGDQMKEMIEVSPALFLKFNLDDRRDRRRSRSPNRKNERNPSSGRSPDEKKRDVVAEEKVESFVSNNNGNEVTNVEEKQ
jgi:hypothetical protein